ncbi:MAG: carboxylating nicotinate-nucleotide diphosphorylase [Bacteroidales bacterium]|nr:carboxylating nicotinate-nucleotide diphosphorylase [Bacteroidales bacterium]
MTLDEIILSALSEDIGDGDHTSLATIPQSANGRAHLLVKESGILAGMEVAQAVFKAVNPEILFKPLLKDGTAVEPGMIAFEVNGPSRDLLSAERLALNFMQRMSGIATKTNYFVKMVEGTGAVILDTRKTTPNFRLIEKWAVRIGGGQNHRTGLYDMILIKDNHVDFAGGIVNAISNTLEYLKKNNKSLPVEIEVRNLAELKQVLDFGGVNRIMLDNFPLDRLKEAIKMVGGQYETEASGGITETTLRSIAETGVNFISVGALTHHIKSLDLSLKAF